MSMVRIALANVEFPSTREESVRLAEQAIAQASAARADIVCFPECFVPGYRRAGAGMPPPDRAFLEHAWAAIARAAGKANVAVVLGTERVVDGALLACALVINRDGTMAGFQDKVQIDPSEEGTAFVRPDGTLLSYQPYGQAGLLIADIDIGEATGLLASRFQSPC